MTRRTWQLGPILRGIREHRIAATLVTLQLAIGLVIAITAVQVGAYFVVLRGPQPALPLDDLTLVELQLPGRVAGTAAAERAGAELLARVRGAPEVVAATTFAQPPLRPIERFPDELASHPGGERATVFELEGGPGLARTLGLSVVAGRDLTDDDLAGSSTAALVPTSLARTLYADRDPIGQLLISRGHGAVVIVGVTVDLTPPGFGFSVPPLILYAHVPRGAARTLVLARTRPGGAAALRATLSRAFPAASDRVVIVEPGGRYIDQAATTVRAGFGVIGFMTAAIVIVALFGSLALTYFLVASRTREIGLRRALGATRADVIRSFVLENTLLTAAGTLLALVGFGVLAPRMLESGLGFPPSWTLVMATVVAFWVLNHVATRVPARRAAAVPAAVASRSS